jgi:hypothetical protein
MNRIWLLALLLVTLPAVATEWVEVGADTEARFYIDVDSIEVDGENVRVRKRGIYTQVLTDELGGNPTTFRETIGTIELDCKRRINRVLQIDMIGLDGEVAWSSGRMRSRAWEEVKPNSHAEITLNVVCARLSNV